MTKRLKRQLKHSHVEALSLGEKFMRGAAFSLRDAKDTAWELDKALFEFIDHHVDYVVEDAKDAAHFFQDAKTGLAHWWQFEQIIVADKLWSMCLQTADQTELWWFDLWIRNRIVNKQKKPTRH